MSKKSVIILGSVVVVCGLFSSLFVDWPVDFSSASGDIAKATRFSREQASEKLTNMEELLQTDSAFKDGIVAAQVIMQTRAVQFGSLVDMSNEVAGEIPAFAEVLKDMNAAREMVNNVVTSLSESGQNLNAALDGEKCADLEQTTINASLAYTTLQKQNKLATRFIETTDKYLETAQGDDHLKFVRDQWVDYQKMTAALDGDKAAAEALAKKGNLLSGEKTLVAMADFGVAEQTAMVQSALIIKNMEIDGSLAKALPEEALVGFFTKVRSATEVYGNQPDQAGVAKFNQNVIDALNEAIIVAKQHTTVGQKPTIGQKPTVGQKPTIGQKPTVGQKPTIGQKPTVGQKPTIGQKPTVGQKPTIGQKSTLEMMKGSGSVVFNQIVEMVGSNPNVMDAYTNAVSKVASQQVLPSQVNAVIKSTCVGNKPELKKAL